MPACPEACDMCKQCSRKMNDRLCAGAASGMSCETQAPIQAAKASQQDRIANVLEK